MDDSPLMDVNELAAYLQIHRETIYRLIKRRKLPAFKVGYDWRFGKEEIDRWLCEQQKKSEYTR
jgi:excisionase family DNA binding protein